MNSLEVRAVREQIGKLLDIPEQIEAQGRILTGLRANRRTSEGELKAREAEIRKDLLTDSVYLKQCRNKEEREAYVEHVQFQDAAWSKLRQRLDQLAVAIDKHALNKEVLDHQRKALKAALEREYALALEGAMHDQALTQMTVKQGGTRA